jgi:DNA (cytosine-5)-methyltransferase 1
MNNSSHLKCFDICCGAGIFSLGFRKIGFEVLGGIDIDKDSIETARMNDGNGRWEQFSIEALEQHLKNNKKHIVRKADIILAGLPCQGFSIAGTRDPSDQRNRLYKHLLSITAIVKPNYVVIENVRGILAERNASTFSKIVKGLEDQGYKVDFRLYNAANLGTPQYRYRVFILASRDVEPRFIFGSIRFVENHQTVQRALAGLPRVKEDKSINHTFMDHGNKVERKISKIQDAKIISYRRLQLNRPSLTITSGHNALPLHPTEHRAISNREAARLQGIPDSFLLTGPRTSQTIQVANAVPFPMARSFAKALKRSYKLQKSSRGELFRLLVTGTTKRTKNKMTKDFVSFYKQNKRNFPWRRISDPYKILISEILLQRTKSETVNKYWQLLIPNINPLRNGTDFRKSSVRKYFKKLGIYNRVDTIKKFNRSLKMYFENRLPKNFDELMQLPGVGIYIASAVRTFAFNIPDFPVDANAFRFTSRFFGLKITGKKSEARQIREYMNTVIDQKKPREFVYGFLDFCAKVCKPGKPECDSCFLKEQCRNKVYTLKRNA